MVLQLIEYEGLVWSIAGNSTLPPLAWLMWATCAYQVGLQPDVLCKADPEGFRAWLADDSRPSNLMKDGCLSMAVQQLQLNDRSSASLSGANAPVDQSQPMTDDKGALWRAHVASVQAH